MTDLLFVYGTLLQQGNTYADYLNQHCTYLSPGKIKGLLYDIGEYPGLVIATEAENYVYGSIYKLHQPDKNLKVIDDYEGYGAEQELPNLYIRIIKQIETTDSIINAWIYLYNLNVGGLPLIPSGDYAQYIRQKKSPGN